MDQKQLKTHQWILSAKIDREHAKEQLRGSWFRLVVSFLIAVIFLILRVTAGVVYDFSLFSFPSLFVTFIAVYGATMAATELHTIRKIKEAIKIYSEYIEELTHDREESTE